MGSSFELGLKGDWIARETGVRGDAAIEELLDRLGREPARLQVTSRELGQWDSAHVLFVSALENEPLVPV